MVGSTGSQLCITTTHGRSRAPKWGQESTPIAPTARHLFAQACDNARNAVVVFGGYNGVNALGDTWEYSPCESSDDDSDGDGYQCSLDCDDNNPAVYPGATQVCDGVNNDCADPGWPQVPLPERDMDGDGFRPCSGDCDEGSSTVYPGALQLCDGVNNDCTDPSWPQVPLAESDMDGDGFRPCSGECDDEAANVFPGAPQLCDGVNNDCNDPGWPQAPLGEADADADGYRICGGDCNDASATVHPGASEFCDGLDNDCNGQTDEDGLGEDTDGDGVHNVCDNSIAEA